MHLLNRLERSMNECLFTIVLTLFLLLFHLPLATRCYEFPQPLSSDNVETVQSPIDETITISYKQPKNGTCTTVFASQKQYTGYVELPPYTLYPIQQNYTINTFFWFIEARTSPETAPLTIYLNGGPGSSSMIAMFTECGPCEPVEISKTRIGTQARIWGWDRSSNVLFIDQPNQVGFSYDTPTNGSIDLLSGNITYPSSEGPSSQPEGTFLNGTFGSGNSYATANTTEIAAHAIWHMLQGFLSVFPQYNPSTRSTNSTQNGVVGVNLFAESYGGKFGPLFASYWEEQNGNIESGLIANGTALEIKLVSLGIVNGCIDDSVQGIYYPKFAYNNTYGIQAISLFSQEVAANEFLSSNGCQQRIQSCRNAATTADPSGYGDVTNVDTICKNAYIDCFENVIYPYYQSGRSPYDITQKEPNPIPPSTYIEYLNDVNVQQAIGVPINFTESNTLVSKAFLNTGDFGRGGQIEGLANLVDSGVRVALIYGDRDYICNWLGGEAVSFSIAAQASGYGPFYKAGYADIIVNSSYVGGVVRQFGNLSFSRIYDAGHLVPAYQPETAFTLFTRIIMGTDLSTGQSANLTTFRTSGDDNATFTSSAPPSSDATCWIRDIPDKCTDDQISMIEEGEGVTINGVLYDNEKDWATPAANVTNLAGYPGSLPATVTIASTLASHGSTKVSQTANMPTGVYVATGGVTPTPTKKSAGAHVATVNIKVATLLAFCLVCFNALD